MNEIDPASEAFASALAAEGRAMVARIGGEVAAWAPLQGDVSPRRYFRATLADHTTVLAAWHPPELLASAERFRNAAALLEEADVRVPRILFAERPSPWILLEDLGESTLYEEMGRGWEYLEPLLVSAASAILRIQEIPLAAVSGLGNPPLDAELFRRELAQTLDLFLRPRRLAGDGELGRRFESGLDEMCDRLAREPRVACHRDYMVRNLIAPRSGGVAVIDFQDLRLGPSTYDIASLVNDSLAPSAELERRILARAGFDPRELSYRRAVAQRMLKIVGTFVRFAERGFARHLPLVAPSLERGLGHLLALPETRDPVAALAGRWREEIERGRIC